MNLHLDHGVLGQQDRTPTLHPPHQTRNGPSQQRRRERQAAARLAAGEQAKVTLSLEEKDVLKKSEKAETEFVTEKVIQRADAKVAGKVINIVTIEEVKDTEQVVQDEGVDRANIVHDEVCSNASYSEGKSTASPSPSALPPPRPSRGLGSFDYYLLKFEDFDDDDSD
jgi:hypothetical protein